MHRLLLLTMIIAACGEQSTLGLTQLELTRGADDRVTAVIDATCQTYTGGGDTCAAPICVRMNVFAGTETEVCDPITVFDTIEDCVTATMHGGQMMTFTLTSTMAIPDSGYMVGVLADYPGDACQTAAAP